MAVLVVEQVCRFIVHGSYEGHDIVNIVDMQVETTGSIVDRGKAVDDQAGVILNEWSDSILPKLSNQYIAQSVGWIDLNSATGTTGERSSTDQKTWPLPGASTSGAQPGNVAARVNKNTIAARGQRQGRMFLVGVPEPWSNESSPNTIQASTIADVNPGLASFLGDINQETGGTVEFAAYTSKMVVVHVDAEGFTSFSEVNSLTLDTYLSSQVRRIRR